MRTRRFVAVLPVFVIVFAAAGCAPTGTPSPTLTPITLQLKAAHSAQFAGFYAAAQNGYFQAEGLVVTLLPGSADINIPDRVLNGAAQFGVAGAIDLIPARAGGEPLVAIGTIFRRNANVLFALSSTGITRPQDFVGKKIRSVADMPLILHAMTTRVGITPDQYTEVNVPVDVALFATGDPPVWGAYSTGMLFTVQQAGYKVNIIYPDDYGVHFYGDTIFTTDDMIAKNPDLTLRFLRASLKGWTWAVENSAAVGPMVMKYLPTADAAMETAKMIASIPLINTGEDSVGWMRPEIWTGMEATLREQSVMTKALDLSQVYTMQFLREVYK
jgi:NitT/TauT family transport system substrate-binding protein